MEGVSYDIGEPWATKKDPVRRRCGTRSFIIYSFGEDKEVCPIGDKGDVRGINFTYSHSMVPMGLGVRSRQTRLMPSTSLVMRLVILCRMG